MLKWRITEYGVLSDSLAEKYFFLVTPPARSFYFIRICFCFYRIIVLDDSYY